MKAKETKQRKVMKGLGKENDERKGKDNAELAIGHVFHF